MRSKKVTTFIAVPNCCQARIYQCIIASIIPLTAKYAGKIHVLIARLGLLLKIAILGWLAGKCYACQGMLVTPKIATLAMDIRRPRLTGERVRE